MRGTLVDMLPFNKTKSYLCQFEETEYNPHRVIVYHFYFVLINFKF